MELEQPLLERFGFTDENLPLQTVFHPALTAIFALLAFVLLAALGHRLSTRGESVGECSGEASLPLNGG